MKRVLPISIGLIIVAGLVYALWPKPVPVDIAEVTRGPMLVTVDEEGKTRIKERYVVSSPLAGRLRRIALDPGDPVVAGQTLLAVIEPNDPDLLDARALAEAEARVKGADASVQAAIPNVERAKAALEHAQREYSRTKSLAETSTLTIEELQTDELRVRTTSEEYKASQFAQRIAEFELEQAKAALLRSTSEEESTAEGRRFDILSPISGVVLHVLEESAAVVTAGTPLIEVGDPRDMEIQVDLLSSDAVAVKPGADMILDQWGGDQPLHGRVRLVEPAGYTKISALGVEEQRVDVVGDFVDPPEVRTTLGDEYRVEARIVTWQSDDVLRAPASALFREDVDWAVFVVEGDRARLRKLKVGHINITDAEILDGLSVGDRVILHPGDTITNGVSVVER